MTLYWAYLSIGSNLGDPLHNCCRGIEALCADRQVQLTVRSPFYWTEPVDFLEQQWFLNAVIKVLTSLSPLALLAKLQAVQASLGRKADTVRFGPRLLDLDIIFYQDLVIQTAQLAIPHPRMHKRRFVLQPICDIDPQVLHPVLLQSVDSLLKQMDSDSQKMRPCSFDC